MKPSEYTRVEIINIALIKGYTYAAACEIADSIRILINLRNDELFHNTVQDINNILSDIDKGVVYKTKMTE